MYVLIYNTNIWKFQITLDYKKKKITGIDNHAPRDEKDGIPF